MNTLQIKHTLLMVFTSLVATLLLSACDSEPATPSQGSTPPSFTLERLKGSSLAYPGDLKGRPAVILFWADWCPACREEMAYFQTIHQQLGAEGPVIMAINIKQQRETAEQFIQGLDITYELLLDRDGEVARDYGVVGLPITFFINREGRVHKKIIGESTLEIFQQVTQELK